MELFCISIIVVVTWLYVSAKTHATADQSEYILLNFNFKIFFSSAHIYYTFVTQNCLILSWPSEVSIANASSEWEKKVTLTILEWLRWGVWPQKTWECGGRQHIKLNLPTSESRIPELVDGWALVKDRACHCQQQAHTLVKEVQPCSSPSLFILITQTNKGHSQVCGLP